MYCTVNVKQEQMANGYVKSGSGPINVLLVGSCRSVPYLNYFVDINGDNAFTIYFIDPFKWHYNKQDVLVDLKTELNKLEKDGRILHILPKIHWFIHERYEGYEMFNTELILPKNIYQFGMKAEIDLTMPNYDNHFILFSDILLVHQDLKAEAKRQLSAQAKLSDELQKEITRRGLEAVEKFCRICELFSSFPEMASKFRNEWTKTRFFWTNNHVSNQFTMSVFKMLMSRLILLPIPIELWNKWQTEDLYTWGATPLTKYDVKNYGISWAAPVTDLVIR